MAIGSLRVELEEVAPDVREYFSYIRTVPPLPRAEATTLGVITLKIDADVMEMAKADSKKFSEVLAKKFREMVTGLAEEMLTNDGGSDG